MVVVVVFQDLDVIVRTILHKAGESNSFIRPGFSAKLTPRSTGNPPRAQARSVTRNRLMTQTGKSAAAMRRPSPKSTL